MKLLCMLASVAWASGHPFEAWERYEKQVRDQTLPKDSLKAGFPAVYGALRANHPGPDPAPIDSPWVFPLAGYSIASVGKGGFKPGIHYGGSSIKGYDFFDGNRHGGHPAYDIFIRDDNRDSRDDRNGKTVAVLAPTGLIVLSKQDSWPAGSPLRGGKYLWALAPQSDLLFYFAHMDSVIANPGDTLRAGQALGTVGRTGKNAQAKRSPTHLHFMVLRVENHIPVPFDYIRFLRR
jgi:hypothetical protein